MPWGLNSKDKIEVKNEKEGELYCRPHCFPHKLAFTEPIVNEPCHYHHAKWRMAHHMPYCFLTQCPNYGQMMQTYNEDGPR